MIVSRPLNANEPDLLVNNEQKDVIVVPMDATLPVSIPATGEGWTHNSLEKLSCQLDSDYPFGWDAYLGTKDHWIGSSEV